MSVTRSHSILHGCRVNQLVFQIGIGGITGRSCASAFLAELDLVLDRLHLIVQCACLRRPIFLVPPRTILLLVLGAGQEKAIVVALGLKVILMDVTQLALKHEVAG